MSRYALIDGLKIIASQSIVIHHFANYGPISDALERFNLTLSDGLYEYGRMAVQIFLVIGGFLAIRSLAPAGIYSAGNPLAKVWQRYRRLAPTFMVAVLWTCLVAALVRTGLPYQFVPLAPEAGQLLAHGLLLHSLLGTEALTAGAWYVALDFQLYALVVVMQWAAARLRVPAQAFLAGAAGMVVLTALSLLVFNLDTNLDHLPWYFFYGYGMGALAYWIGNAPHFVRNLSGLAVLGIAGLLLNFRERLLLALLTALALAVMQHHTHSGQQHTQNAVRPARPSTLVAVLSDSSYALFLVHFSVLMLANLAWQQSSWVQSLGLGWTTAGYWLASMGLALLFQRWVEKPMQRAWA